MAVAPRPAPGSGAPEAVTPELRALIDSLAPLDLPSQPLSPSTSIPDILFDLAANLEQQYAATSVAAQAPEQRGSVTTAAEFSVSTPELEAILCCDDLVDAVARSAGGNGDCLSFFDDVQPAVPPELAADAGDAVVPTTSPDPEPVELESPLVPACPLEPAPNPLADLGALSVHELADYLARNPAALALAKAAVAAPASPGAGAGVGLGVKRRRAKKQPVPDEKKDESYRRRRAKNTEAARKNRARKRRQKQAKLEAAVAKERLVDLVAGAKRG